MNDMVAMTVRTDTTTQRIEAARPRISAKLEPARRSALGQFMTPAVVAHYMASLFSLRPGVSIRLLDPGAGLGALSAAFVQRWQQNTNAGSTIAVTAYEVDGDLRQHLKQHLAACQAEADAHGLALTAMVLPEDFIQAAANPLEFRTRGDFTHAILNPPYKKINSHSMHRKWLRMNGVETVNLYSAFVALALQMLVEGGELVAIIPRSFCNGPYYRPFRDLILRHTSIEHLHLFDSRSKAFKDDEVLQENVIIRLVRGGRQGPVMVSHCADGTFGDYTETTYPFAEIVRPGDTERFIHIPLLDRVKGVAVPRTFHHTLTDLGVEVSTGPVVDFRMKAHLRAIPGDNTVPLLYPCHLTESRVIWPLGNSRKPNAIAMHDETRRWLYPTGCYTAVSRFSWKEEKRRVMAAVVRPSDLADYDWIGFENHLNVFHCGKRGIPEELAYGLCAYLNSSAVDRNVRAFNGHTQVNATDLRSLKYPDRPALLRLGRWLMQAGTVTQENIDERIEALA